VSAVAAWSIRSAIALGFEASEAWLASSSIVLRGFMRSAMRRSVSGWIMPAQELGALVQWEKSRLSHQVRRMQERGLIVREPNPANGRSAIICLLPAGRRAIEDAAPQHVRNVRRDFIDLFSPAELDTFAALNERVLHHLGEESFPEESAPGESALPH
jgi:DNA-binding MarR family transcriptional regulator